MSKLTEKLAVLECEKRRQITLDVVSERLKVVLSDADYAMSPESIYFSAYPTQRNGQVESSRKDVKDWFNGSFQKLPQILEQINKLNITEGTMGWLSFESSTPHYYVDGMILTHYFDELIQYLTYIGDIDLRWTGVDKDCGIIIEQYNQKGYYDFSSWGF